MPETSDFARVREIVATLPEYQRDVVMSMVDKAMAYVWGRQDGAVGGLGVDDVRFAYAYGLVVARHCAKDGVGFPDLRSAFGNFAAGRPIGRDRRTKLESWEETLPEVPAVSLRRVRHLLGYTRINGEPGESARWLTEAGMLRRAVAAGRTGSWDVLAADPEPRPWRVERDFLSARVRFAGRNGLKLADVPLSAKQVRRLAAELSRGGRVVKGCDFCGRSGVFIDKEFGDIRCGGPSCHELSNHVTYLNGNTWRRFATNRHDYTERIPA